MTTVASPGKLRVVIVGGGVAALETLLALAELAPELTATTVIAPNRDFVYRPLAVREPFAYPPATRYPLAPIVQDAGSELLADELAWVDPDRRVLHTRAGQTLEYDALMLALGAHAQARYRHATTIDDRRMDATLHGLIQDVDTGYVRSIAFLAPGRMAWPLPLYELALMTATRAYDMNVQLRSTLVTPENAPLAIFGSAASDAVTKLLTQRQIATIASAYAEIPRAGHIVINPGDRQLEVDRVVALPELYGPSVRGVPLGEHGFIRVDLHSRVPDVERVFAAGDAVEFPVKHGGISSQQADAAAESIAALAGAPLTPKPFHPTIHGMLLTGERPLYISAHITGGHGFSSQVSDEPMYSSPGKISARYLAPYLAERDPATSAA
ncbi:MAG TPA: FAD-dependent oxidoreductase [Solirubrobacteraceae bacterium]|nr:FAD-dependent oxidoreductase [Solirubrobacteraceae bacterium]